MTILELGMYDVVDDADLDSPCHLYADPDSDFYLLRIRIFIGSVSDLPP
jgi:hypothetical protein